MKISDHLFTVIFLIIPSTWAGSFIAAKFVVADVAPIQAVFFRFFFSALVMFPGLILFHRRYHPDFSEKDFLKHLVVVALLAGVGYHIFFFRALKYTTPTNAALIIALNPFFTAFGEILIFKQSRAVRFYFGFLLAFAGAVWVNLTKGEGFSLASPGIGELFCLLASLSWSAYTLFAKKTKKPHWDSLWLNAYNYLLTAVIILPFIFTTFSTTYFKQISGSAWLGLAYMAIFPTAIGYTLFYIGVMRKGPAWAVTFIYLVPSITAVLDFLFFKAALSAAMIIGTTFVVTGLLIGNVNIKYWQKKDSSSQFREI